MGTSVNPGVMKQQDQGSLFNKTRCEALLTLVIIQPRCLCCIFLMISHLNDVYQQITGHLFSGLLKVSSVSFFFCAANDRVKFMPISFFHIPNVKGFFL